MACLLVLLTLLAAAPVPAAVASGASISIRPSADPAGTSVTVTGTGFPGRRTGTVTGGTDPVAFRTSASGRFDIRLSIPRTTGPVVVVRAVSGDVGASATFRVRRPSRPPGTTSLRFGVGTPGGPLASAELDEVTALAGEAPTIVLAYKDFHQAPPIAELDAARARGADTLLTWEPWAWGGGRDQPAYALDRVTAGDFDPYLRRWGHSLADWGHPVLLRFGHEMNGDWYPWSAGVNGNTSDDYVEAWRHVHETLASTGASNVTWVWNPNVPYRGSTPLRELYPGDSYVDAVALDGYNWGTSAPWGTWQVPSRIFGRGLSELRALAPGKEILIAETSSAEHGGSKADWTTELVGYLAAQDDVTAVVWFHLDKETDWRIDSSSTSAAALAEALASRREGRASPSESADECTGVPATAVAAPRTPPGCPVGDDPGSSHATGPTCSCRPVVRRSPWSPAPG